MKPKNIVQVPEKPLQANLNDTVTQINCGESNLSHSELALVMTSSIPVSSKYSGVSSLNCCYVHLLHNVYSVCQ